MNILECIKSIFPYRKEFLKYKQTKQIGTFCDFIKFKFCRSKTYYYLSPRCTIVNTRKIFVGINSIIGRSGNYINGAGTIIIGNYVRLAEHVGLVSSNHDLYDHNISHGKKIVIGDYCWIGMNSVITAGVELGTRTIVGAGSVVTKSFPEGYCVIAGNPAKKIKELDKNEFHPWHYKEEWYGFIPKEEFEKKRKKYIDI